MNFVVRDDFSDYGLRRLHMLSTGQIGVEDFLERVEREGGELQASLSWQDEVGNFHVYLAWRQMMGEAMQFESMEKGDGNLGPALMRAISRYGKRVGRLPNRAVVREGTPGPEKLPVKCGEQEIVMRIGRVEWMRAGDVGVWWEDEPEG